MQYKRVLRIALLLRGPDVDTRALKVDGALQGSLITAVQKPRNYSKERSEAGESEPESGNSYAPSPTSHNEKRSHSHSQTTPAPHLAIARKSIR